MSTHLSGSSHFFRFLHHFIIAKSATRSIRVKPIKVNQRIINNIRSFKVADIGVNFSTRVFPPPSFYLAVEPIQRINCLKGLLRRNTLSIT